MVPRWQIHGYGVVQVAMLESKNGYTLVAARTLQDGSEEWGPRLRTSQENVVYPLKIHKICSFPGDKPTRFGAVTLL